MRVKYQGVLVVRTIANIVAQGIVVIRARNVKAHEVVAILVIEPRRLVALVQPN